MDWSQRNLLACVVPAGGDLLINQTSISMSDDKDAVIAVHIGDCIRHSLIHYSANPIKALKWGAAGLLMTLDTQNTLFIYRMGETMQNWDLVHSTQLESCIHFSWYQRQELIECIDSTPTLVSTGPKLCFGELQFATIDASGKITLKYENGERKLATLESSIQGLEDKSVVSIDSINTENGLKIGMVSPSELTIGTFQIDLFNSKFNVSSFFRLSVNNLKMCKWADEGHLAVTTENKLSGSQELMLYQSSNVPRI